ncbi:MAG: carbamoyl phosphate synthase large subunit [Deltaproteobacteria bacterium RIFCSPLOWO2_12_FULL_40_28]|nr:MAG: carbamoyl phosphate synthase large subunit [Deltaproteobacteria bacterium RIFCSPHIGHO2_02_FULL_40_28]OGQ20279.1 MAG: carbamoyl phosphate synthase large subunit [Deltaproteobacteria bacterium RIFCSPHIGHO2_12_FULL_40_32]OGQ40390.1 MAG: carbamoyl phosphate synthase large subunit [Deltaproteobacteria bacterium RIFCSPLOWO2_02_FULL_40_36]OGQ54859.1 MAG: carbamoyl phosphate synthase large subunit [Deltaproteobacteria bacterium RIFCSPLOWO2_12_FULL_40_28]
MPKREDIQKILIIGAGPIIIGQACEFDYSGTQGVKALKEEGYQVVLINSNPATIMTDPDLADATYIEPITPFVVEMIIEKEKPQALLPTLGGQTALNTAVSLAKMGILKKHGVELIGAQIEAIEKAEDRQLFKKAMEKIGLRVPRGGLAHSMKEALKLLPLVGFPAIIRPAFTLGGTGGNVCYSMKEFKEYAAWGLECSPVSQILVEQSILGWKEYELEVMRDKKDNVVIICSIENFDPMGIHTGDSITVAPAQTLTDKEYQIMRDASIRIIREIGVETGGSNIQFGVNPKNGELIVIEMNPRVSRSSALASKATGFPIAKIATKLAIGYTLDEIENDITRYTPASFEPTIDYVVTKIPRFTFEKFPQADDRLTTQMKSVGEVMAIGRTFKESLQKAMRSLETDTYGFEEKKLTAKKPNLRKKELLEKLKIPRADRLWWIGQAFREGMTVEQIYKTSFVDPWFLKHIEEIISFEKIIKQKALKDAPVLKQAKQMGFSDRRIAALVSKTEDDVRYWREQKGILPVFKRVDTCGAEFEAHTPYLYSTYEWENEANPTHQKKVVILGGGPNRIGQGIEFDYCCCHASFALHEEGYETIMINCNPETVSTDYDTSDRLYFEPLTKEDVIRILQEEKPDGIIVQFGGQTPLKLAVPLEKWGAKILGTSSDSIDQAEDRERFSKLLDELKLNQPSHGLARTHEEAMLVADRVGYPVLVRPSYVLGGRAMEIIYDEKDLKRYMHSAVQVSEDRPVLIDQYLEGAIEVDVDAISDGEMVVIGGIMEHVEHAGVHSGDSACCLPPNSLDAAQIEEISRQAKSLALRLKVVGLMNVQFAVKDQTIYILEVNPRASRTVPFVSKAIGVPLAKLAAKVSVGRKLTELGFTKEVTPPYKSVKEAVFPFIKFPGVDTLLGPEMKSTGEVMGIDVDFGTSFLKAQLAANTHLPVSGVVFVSVRDKDKTELVSVVLDLTRLGFSIIATRGTAYFLSQKGINVSVINKVSEGCPHIVDAMEDKKIAMVINTHEGKNTARDSFSLRRTALMEGIPYFTTMAGAKACVLGIESLQAKKLGVLSLQDYQSGRLSVKRISLISKPADF